MVMRKILLVALLLAACDVPTTSNVDDVSSDGEEGESYLPYDAQGAADSFTPSNGSLEFDGACEEGERLTIAALGDVLLHGRLQQQAFAEEDRYIGLWQSVVDLMAAADVTYANLEGPTAAGVNSSGRAVNDPGQTFDNYVYTSYPMFNYNPALLADLRDSGIDVVSTANNHSLDRRSLGVDRTLEALDVAGLSHSGTRHTEAPTAPWYGLTSTAGFNLAWLACTYGTNGIPDNNAQILFCFQDRTEVLTLIEELSQRSDIDAVIFTPHWGSEYHATPNTQQVDLAHDAINAGATAVIGSHPHVLQPWERYVTADGREGFVIYSLGNFVSGQSHLPRRSTLLLYLGLTRTTEGRIIVNGARYVPLHMSRRDGLRLEVVDEQSDLGDSRALTVGMFGGWNLHAPTSTLDTAPQCDPEWEPAPAPHPHDGWIGGSCEDDSLCGGAECAPELPGGLCTEMCDGICPDRLGRAVTFCVDLGFDDGGRCVARCGTDYDCRRGWRCEPTERWNNPELVRSVCVPDVATE